MIKQDLSPRSKKKMKNTEYIPVNEPLLDGNEKKYVLECLETGWISSEGPFVSKFEDIFAEKVNRKYGIAVCNGSAALEAAVIALNIGKGDEVIMPDFTIISCAAAIIRAGAKPVLVDADPLTWNMNVTQIESKITPKTKAIMVVHIYGLPTDMDPVINLADKYGLKIIEDAAEAHGQTYRGKPCGSFGDVSCFSFYPNKHITTGEGGMIMTDDSNIADRCRSLRNLCHSPERRFVHYELGWNLRMTNIQAAIGCAQTENLEKHIIRKREIGKRYNESLKDLPIIQIPLESTDYANNIYWVYGILLKDEVPYNADQANKMLYQNNIGTRPFFYPMHQQPVFRQMGLFKGEEYPVASKLSDRGFYIPSGLGTTDHQIEIVVDTVINLFK